MLPTQALVPGGLAIIDLSEFEQKPKLWLGNKACVVIKQNNSYIGVVGIPLTSPAGALKVSIEANDKHFSKTVNISAKEYPFEELNIKDATKVTPPPEVVPRILQEQKDIHKAYSNWVDIELSDLELQQPVSGRFSSPFGYRRILNGVAKQPHSGLDIANIEGTPILAPKDGTVLLSNEFYFNGNGVFLDHGQGLITHYCHMQTINVKPGQFVRKGEQIGTVGATGRVTGPHLHWSVSLNDTRVDPMLFLKD